MDSIRAEGGYGKISNLAIVNIVAYLIVICLMIASLVTGADQVAQYKTTSKDGDDDFVLNTVLLLSSFYSVIIIFSILSIVALGFSGPAGIFSNTQFRTPFLVFNSVILAFSLLILLPTAAAVNDIGADGFTGSLIGGTVLALFLSLVNVSIVLHKTRTM